MPARSARLYLALSLLVALTGLNLARRRGVLRPLDSSPGPVRIVRFIATRGTISPGESAQLCYAVENARAVRIPPTDRLWPVPDHCFDVVPEHTTHYALLAEGFDGKVVTRSLTLSVQPLPSPRAGVLQYAARPSTTTRTQRRTNS